MFFFILAGETAKFNFQLDETPVNVTWMKDNKAIEDKRVSFNDLGSNTYQLEIKSCVESDSGTYTARASNGFENATCTAQLTVEKGTSSK
jgi:hypothetical protein